MWLKTYKKGTSGFHNARYQLHALHVMNLTERTSFPYDPEDIIADNDPTVYFIGGIVLQRPALLLDNGVIYGAWGSHCDHYNYTGMVIGVDTNAKKKAFWVAEAGSKRTKGSGIWMGGCGLSSDGTGRFYAVTGNGDTSVTTRTPGKNPGKILEAVVALNISKINGKLSATDFFEPYNYTRFRDTDLGSGGLTLLPSQYFGTKTIPNIGVVSGKSGHIYILDADHLGGYQTGPNHGDGVLQRIFIAGASSYAEASAYPEGGYLYLNMFGKNTQVFKYGLNKGVPQFHLVGEGQTKVNRLAGSPQITSVNGQSASLWYTDVGGFLYVYDAVPVKGILPMIRSWNLTAKHPQPVNKFVRPAIGNGHVYIATSDARVIGFGLGSKPGMC
ncbi:hypothetical protein BZG36_01167 [Bifiguratus adelaidae]|uniref:Uncharacterized protein n=1 Tax=Bifiguratus adelaidae TaxID=1938954 RepID=A0A261Y637_9FUNG|nr:hypothetical protein BZG36_01167 [Bifiguratus adelaidae]